MKKLVVSVMAVSIGLLSGCASSGSSSSYSKKSYATPTSTSKRILSEYSTDEIFGYGWQKTMYDNAQSEIQAEKDLASCGNGMVQSVKSDFQRIGININTIEEMKNLPPAKDNAMINYGNKNPAFLTKMKTYLVNCFTDKGYALKH